MRVSESVALSGLRAGPIARWRRLAAVFGVAGALHLPVPLGGQVVVQDFVISGGVAGEAWRGDFTAISVPQIDSTERAVAWVGEWSVNGMFTLFAREHRTVEATLDAGFRQFATGGFQLRNYAPREYGGVLTTRYRHAINEGRSGTLIGEAGARVRGITDRPPMPLYLAPGHETYRVRLGYGRSFRDLDSDLAVTVENADYAPPALLRNLDQLDRSSVIVEAGVGRRNYRASNPEDYSRLRFFGAYRYHSYPKQGLGVLRADRAVGLGGTYELRTDRLDLRITLDGTRSRSTSRRVEYNAGRLDAQMQWALSEEMGLIVAGTVGRKRHIHPGEDALVPGEEADNETTLYVELTRNLGLGVDGAFRLGWQKVETNFSGEYYTRVGGAFFLRARP